MDILGQSALIVALAAFTLAVTALSRNLRNRLVIMYALLCGVVSSWAFCFFLEKVFGTGTFYKSHLSFNLILAPIGILFVRVLTRLETAFLRWLFRFSVFYAAIVIGLEWGGTETPFIRNLAYFGPSILVFVCVYFMVIDWRLKRTEKRAEKTSIERAPTARSSINVGLARRTWIYVGALFILGTASMDHIPKFGDIVPSVGNIFLCLYLFIVSEAVIHQRLLNASGLFNRVLVLVFISTILAIIYTVFVAWIENAPALFVLNTFLASFIILILIDPLKKLTSFAVSRAFSRRFLKFEGRVAEAQLQLTGVLDTIGLSQLTIQMLVNVLRCESATVFVLRSDGTKFRRIRGLRDDALANREILANHPIVDFFSRMKRRGETPVLLDQYLENEIDRTTSQSQRQTYDLVLKGMAGINANIVFPFMDGSTVLGFVGLRAQSPPEPWGNNWGVLSAIYPFFTQATRTLKNMDVYVRLREKDRLAALGEMAAGLAHEIRNPLGAIKGAAQYLEPQSGDSQGAFLNVIIEEVNRLNKVVTQFLDYSKPLSTDLVEYDVGTMLERTTALFKSMFFASTGEMKSALAQDPRIELIPPTGGFATLPKIHCAPEQIKQVLVNLVQNSIQALRSAPPSDGGVIRVSALSQRRLRDGVLEVILSVEDNGKGISRENIEKIFIPFFTTSPSGTGLGLPICSRIIEAHGGSIDVLSEEGKFTRFSVHLPVSEKSILQGEVT